MMTKKETIELARDCFESGHSFEAEELLREGMTRQEIGYYYYLMQLGPEGFKEEYDDAEE